MKKRSLFAFTFLGLAAAAIVAGVGGASKPQHAEGARVAMTQQHYYCPMHPNYTSDKAGSCPICGMQLVLGAQGAAAVSTPEPTHSPAMRKLLFYRSPMDPSVHSSTPAKDSMGMDFIPVYEDEVQGGSSVPGRAAVSLSPERRASLGIRVAPVEAKNAVRTIRTVGNVAVDERRLQHVHTKLEGYVERLYVNYAGRFVTQGEPLLSIYSPELVATQQEYLLAYRAQKELGSSEVASVAKGGADLLAAARQRLLFWDIQAKQIDRLERTGEVMRTLDLYSHVNGFVVQKMVTEGQRVMPADSLFDVADLSHVWVMVDVYESDLPLVRTGMPADITVPYLPGRTWRGPVTYVAPTVEEKTRTVKLRVEVDNKDGTLKPDMYSDVVLRAPLGRSLVVPEAAIVRSGERTLVFVEQSDGRLAPRAITVGAKVEEGTQVLDGLREGESVVLAANFLLDSESSLKAAIAAMTTASPAPSPSGHKH
jgi:RND family efflux transporter MFP subunit